MSTHYVSGRDLSTKDAAVNENRENLCPHYASILAVRERERPISQLQTGSKWGKWDGERQNKEGR